MKRVLSISVTGFLLLFLAVSAQAGGAAFGTQQVISTAADDASSVFAADLDGDGCAEIVVPDPGFPIYASMARFLGLVPVALPVRAQNGFRIDLDELRRLDALEVDGDRLDGVVVGREVTAGRFTIEEAIHTVH